MGSDCCHIFRDNFIHGNALKVMVALVVGWFLVLIADLLKTRKCTLYTIFFCNFIKQCCSIALICDPRMALLVLRCIGF